MQAERKGQRVALSPQTPSAGNFSTVVILSGLVLVALIAYFIGKERELANTSQSAPKAPVTVASVLDEFGLRGALR